MSIGYLHPTHERMFQEMLIIGPRGGPCVDCGLEADMLTGYRLCHYCAELREMRGRYVPAHHRQ